MAVPLKIDFVSDVSCPWCAVGLRALEEALAKLGDAVEPTIRFQPFELNPQMPAEGENTDEHLFKKYRMPPEQAARNRENIRARGAELGFVFNRRDRVYNTFDAHRLLHWAGIEGKQLELKHALLKAYFTDGRNVGSTDELAKIAGETGLDESRAREVLTSGAFADDVRTEQLFWQKQGITAVPSVIIDDSYLIQGGQPVEAFEGALRRIAGLESAAKP